MATLENEEQHILESWNQNAKAWTRAIQQNEIQSRITTTNDAIVSTILDLKPKSVLDVGCGEGWLARTISSKGIDVLGIDAVPALIEQAKLQGGARFEVCSYEELNQGKLNEQFELAVCNFSLLGNESVIQVFGSMSKVLVPNGYFVVQTINPKNVSIDIEEGWQMSTWDGFNSEFTNPPPWYYRSVAVWEKLFEENNLNLIEIKEPINSQTQQVASIIFVSQLK